jgi:uncharacterized membrane protein
VTAAFFERHRRHRSQPIPNIPCDYPELVEPHRYDRLMSAGAPDLLPPDAVRWRPALWRRSPWVFAAAAIVCQIAYPLVSDDALRAQLTIGTVVVFFLATVSSAAVAHGPRAALVLVLVAGGGGFVAEAAGVATGYPFGSYVYDDALGPTFLGVPLVIPLAWTMMAYPALLVGRRLSRRYVPIVGGWALASWDVFLDPQMVAAGFWRWEQGGPQLPGIPGIPVTNFLGWALVSVLVMVVLHAALPRTITDADEAVPAVLYLWTFASQVLANAVFFGRPWVAIIGGVAMGIVAVPYAVALRRSRK